MRGEGRGKEMRGKGDRRVRGVCGKRVQPWEEGTECGMAHI